MDAWWQKDSVKALESKGNFLSRLERAYGIVVDLMVDDDDDRFVRYDRENSFTVGFARMVKRPAC